MLSAQEKAGRDSLDFQLSAPMDSLKRMEEVHLQSGRIDSIRGESFQVKKDTTLKPVKGAADSLLQKTEAKIDSLKVLELPHGQYTQRLDSLKQVGQQPLHQLQELETKGKREVNSLSDKVNFKVQKETAFVNRIPGAELSNDQLSDLPKVPDTPINKVGDLAGGFDIPVPELDIENTIDPKIETPALESKKLGSYQNKVKDAAEFPAEKVGELKDESGFNKAAEGIEEVKGYGDEVNGYQEDIAKAKEGDLEGVEKRAEQKLVENMNELGGLQGQENVLKQEMEQQAQQLKQVQDQAYIKQQLQEQAMMQVQDQFSGEKLEKLKAARQKLSKQKKSYVGLRNISDSLKVKRSSLKGKPFRERITPGFAFEVFRGEVINLDLALGVGYKFNKRISLHSAYMYRFSFDKNANTFVWKNPSYGPRFYGVYTLSKSFRGIILYEQIRTNVPRNRILPETSRNWEQSAYVGVGKAYAISKLVKGDLQVLYNFMYNHKTPYPKRVHIRMGFDFNLKKKRKLG